MNAADIKSALSPASADKWESIRRRMQAHDSNPVVIRPLKPMHRAILAMQFASR